MKSENDLDKMNRVLSIYSIVVNGNLGYKHLRPRCVEILSYYLLFGYNSDVKKMIKSNGMTSDNLTQINYELTKAGFLIKDDKNFHNRVISKELSKLKDYFFNEEIKNKMYIIQIDE